MDTSSPDETSNSEFDDSDSSCYSSEIESDSYQSDAPGEVLMPAWKELGLDMTNHGVINRIPPDSKMAKYHGEMDKVWLNRDDMSILDPLYNIEKRLKTHKVTLDEDHACPC
jgi:hypothetical protein